MRKRNIRGEIAEDYQQPRDKILLVRVSAAEEQQVHYLMEQHGYRTVSALLRDLLFTEKIGRKHIVRITDEVMTDRVNRILRDVNKIGVNYNQVAAAINRISLRNEKKASLSPTQALGKLMRLTESLRDEVAVMIDLFKRYNSKEISDGEN